MVWLLLSLVIYLLWWVNTLNGRVNKLEENQPTGFSFAYNFDFRLSVRNHPSFPKLTGIKSAEETQDYTKWTKKDQDIFQDMAHDFGLNTYLRIGYIAPSETFFVQYGDKTHIILKKIGTTSLYSNVVLGDKNGIKENLSLEIDARVIKTDKGYSSVITAYLKPDSGDLRKEKITHLFDFPYTRTDMSDSEFQSLGFEVKHQGGDDIYEDDYGERQPIPDVTTLKKHGAEIRIVS